MNDPDVEQVKAALYTAPDDFPYEKLHSKASDAIYRISIRLAELEAENQRLQEQWKQAFRFGERGGNTWREVDLESRLRRIEEAAKVLLDADSLWAMADCVDLPQARAAVVHAKLALREVLDEESA